MTIVLLSAEKVVVRTREILDHFNFRMSQEVETMVR